MTSFSVPSVSSLSHILLTDFDWWIGCFLEERSLTNAMSVTLARFACELVLQDHGDDLQLGLFDDLLRRCERERVPFFVHSSMDIVELSLLDLEMGGTVVIRMFNDTLYVEWMDAICKHLCDFEHRDALGQEDINAPRDEESDHDG
jgi:hypothetical protein